MIAYKEILEAFNKKIKAKFPEVELTNDDSDEDILRPSFGTSIKEIKETNFMNQYRESNFNINIRYFANTAKKNMSENLNVIDELKEVFLDDPIIDFDNFSVEIYDEVSIDIIDGIVQFVIPVFISDEIIENNEEILLEEIEMN